MASLATLPTDILEQVGIIASSQSLADLLHLMLTCRTVHDQLSIAYNPHVYASISRQIFDVPFLRQGVPPDSAIAAELIQRLRLFRRIRRGDLSVQALPEALWTAYGLVLEGGSLNASHLAAAGFSAFIEEVLRTYSARTDDRNQREARMACRNLATWLLALTITRDDIVRMSEEAREELLGILRPLAVDKEELSGKSVKHVFDSTRAETSSSHVVFYSQKQRPRPQCPPVSSAAITLCFALRQTHVPLCALDLPADRAAAIATQRSGPTLEDYNAMASFRTPLFAETLPSTSLAQRAEGAAAGATASHTRGFQQHHDPCLTRLHVPYTQPPSVYSYIQNNLQGLWEGALLISPLILPDTNESSLSAPSDAASPDFISQHPMQCSLSVHLCFTPTLPVTWGHMSDEDPFKWDVAHQSLCAGAYKGSDCRQDIAHNSESFAWRHPDQALDCLIIGQTTEEHADAWGAYNFYGRVKRDGKIVMRRQPKNSWDTTFDSRIFEGYLHYGNSWVGTWRSCIAPGSPAFKGIFSMRKREDPESQK
ncbi:hypothetical protein BDZ89DRAFT_1066563 [Hymenopellis radicata]|nr:hypothetical protein BDZ89DRAFT_1066563 [Hymenopellis radicata]